MQEEKLGIKVGGDGNLLIAFERKKLRNFLRSGLQVCLQAGIGLANPVPGTHPKLCRPRKKEQCTFRGH